MGASALEAPRTALRWLGDRSAASLAAIQGFLGLEFLAYAWHRPVSGGDAALAMAVGMIALAGVTLLVIRRASGHRLAVLLQVALILSWVAVAVVTASRYTPQGQVALGMSVLVLAVWAAYVLPFRAAMAQTFAMVLAYGLVLLLVDPPVDAFFAVFAGIVIVSLAVLVTRLRVVDARYRLLIDNAADIVFHTREGILVWISPSIADLLGWDPDELVGRPTAHLWHPDDRDAAVALRDAVYGGVAGEAVLRLRAKDGDYRWVDIAMQPYVDARGGEGAVGSFRDVTARVEAEQALERSLAEQSLLATQLEAVDRAKSRMFQNISHEFRTPLTIIQGPQRELLADPSVRLSTRQRQDLEGSLRATERLQRLVDGLLEVARGEAGQLVVDRRPMDLPLLTRQGVAMFASAAANAGLELTVDIHEFPPLVRADPELWTRVLLNLVSNAIKYTSVGGIHVGLSYADGRARLSVSDTGAGIDQDQLPFIFERFHQATNSPVRGHTGSGIGLALVMEIVTAVGGTIDVTSTPSGGTTFVVEFPAEECAGDEECADFDLAPLARASVSEIDPVASSAWAPVPPDAPAEAGLRGGSVLLVEDNADLRAYLRRLVETSGWQVTGVGDLESARPLVAEHDLVVSDVMLPDGSGVDLARWVRTQADPVRWMPVLLLTAKADRASVIEGIRAGADDYIVKPFDPQELVARIATHMELALLRRFVLDEADGRASNLQKALQSNRTIGTALGIVMASQAITAEQAFDELRRASQQSNRKLRDIADEVVYTGAPPVSDLS